MHPITRRGFIKTSAAFSLAGGASLAEASKSDQGELLLVGTQTSGASKGIYSYRFDETTGELKQTGLAAAIADPTFLVLAPDGKRVYSATETDTFAGKHGGGITGFNLDTASGRLTEINGVPTDGTGTCHVAVDHTGHCAFAANYSGGSSASFHLDSNGHLSEAVSFFQYEGHGPNTDRQEKAHAHRVTVSPDNKFLLVNDLGLDRIHIYKLDAKTAKLTPNDPPAWKSAPGSGPRALRFHPSGKWAYCVNELASTVDVLAWNGEHGTLTQVQQIELLPEGYKGPTRACDIVLDREGQFAYVANRDNNFMASFTVVGDGRLTMIERTNCGGKTPRHIALSPQERWLLVANQDSNNISVFARDAHTGKLSNEGKSFPLANPMCLVFA